MNKRRSFLKLFSLGSILAGLGYSLNRGIRYPSLSLEPNQLSNEFATPHADYTTQEVIKLPANDSKIDIFRAYAPEPSIHVIHKTLNTINFTINNVANDAVLICDELRVTEKIDGITRHISVPSNTAGVTKLKWHLPALEEYKFAAIGDTGGGKELEWCIERAHQSGARFFLHLGDFHYEGNDYKNAISLFHNAPLPCYVCIGNHDFHNDGLIYDDFLNNIGPLNNQFSINDIRYVNLDTAASFFPVSSGGRRKLLDKLVDEKSKYTDTVLFTHRPMDDPMEGMSHDLGNDRERDWLIKTFKEANINTIICGHIHILSDTIFKNIRQIIAGQGLGHQDLMFEGEFSKLLIGTAKKNEAVRYDFLPLEIPKTHNCHPKVIKYANKKFGSIDSGCG